MIHFDHIFDDVEGQSYIKRIGALKPNGSKKSQAELNNSNTLDTGDHEEFGQLLAALKKKQGRRSIIFQVAVERIFGISKKQ